MKKLVRGEQPPRVDALLAVLIARVDQPVHKAPIAPVEGRVVSWPRAEDGPKLLSNLCSKLCHIYRLIPPLINRPIAGASAVESGGGVRDRIFPSGMPLWTEREIM